MTESATHVVIYLGVITALAAVAIAAARLWPASPFEEEALRRDVPLPDAALGAQIVRYRRRVRTLSYATWWLAMAAVGGPLVGGVFGAEFAMTGTTVGVLVIAAMFLGEALARAVSRPFRPAPGSVRLTRQRRVTPAMFVNRRTTMIPRVAAAIAGALAVATIIVLIATDRHDLFAAGAALIAGLVVVMLTTNILQRVITSRPQPLGSLTELAWDDALRADAVVAARCAMVVLTLCTAIGLGIVLLTALGRSWTAVSDTTVNATLVACIAVVSLLFPWRPAPVPAALRRTLA